jgi:glycosyltransferase involved in cell wall biosynthesis
MKEKSILFIYRSLSTFVAIDQEIIRKYFPIKPYMYKPSKSLIKNIIEQIKITCWLLYNVWKAKAVYIWFVDYHSILPLLFAKILHIKGIVVIGGYDAVAMPSLDYGIFNSPFRSFIAKISYKCASHIIPVDESLIKGVNTYVDPKGVKIGFKNYVKNISAKVITVPTGYNPEKWKRTENIKKEHFVLTVGGAADITTYNLKGFDLFLDLAVIMRDVKFVIVGLRGKMNQYAIEKKSDNVEIYSFMPGDELIDYFQRAKVFCQFSLSEGLPNTLCEAMLCECIPVGSKVNGIPKAIGDCGFILESNDLRKAKELVTKALNSPVDMGRKARNRIMNLFPAEKRETKIVNLLEVDI